MRVAPWALAIGLGLAALTACDGEGVTPDCGALGVRCGGSAARDAAAAEDASITLPGPLDGGSGSDVADASDDGG